MNDQRVLCPAERTISDSIALTLTTAGTTAETINRLHDLGRYYLSDETPPPPGSIRRGGGGSGSQWFVYQKWPNKIFPFVNFVFPHDGNLWSGGWGSPVGGAHDKGVGVGAPPTGCGGSVVNATMGTRSALQ